MSVILPDLYTVLAMYSLAGQKTSDLWGMHGGPGSRTRYLYPDPVPTDELGVVWCASNRSMR